MAGCHSAGSRYQPNRRFPGRPIHQQMEGSIPFTRETGALVDTGGHCEERQAQNDDLRRGRMSDVSIDIIEVVVGAGSSAET